VCLLGEFCKSQKLLALYHESGERRECLPQALALLTLAAREHEMRHGMPNAPIAYENRDRTFDDMGDPIAWHAGVAVWGSCG